MSSKGRLALRTMMMPRDTNGMGIIFGGVLLSYIDLAASDEARQTACKSFVTVAMREVIFHEPVHVGDVVNFYTTTKKVGHTSITITVEVEAERAQACGKKVLVTAAEVVVVSVDEHRNPIPVLDNS